MVKITEKKKHVNNNAFEVISFGRKWIGRRKSYWACGRVVLTAAQLYADSFLLSFVISLILN